MVLAGGIPAPLGTCCSYYIMIIVTGHSDTTIQ